MSNTKTTKRALLSSAVALLICFAMLLGTTFAWFTDSATSGTNQIQAGNLKVDIVDESGTSLVGNNLKFQNKNGETDILWEPGVTFRTQAFKIKNNGNLAFKYRLALNGVTGNAKLLEVIKFSIVKADGTAVDLANFEGTLNTANALSEAYYIQGVMATSAGNEYQGLTLEGVGVTVSAAQLTYETDSFDDQYDKEAGYAIANGVYVQDDGSLKAVSMQALSEVAKLASNDDTITSVTYNGASVPVVRDTAAMNTELANGEATIVLTEGTYTVGAAAGKTVTIVGTENTKVDITSGLTYVRSANITFEGLTIQSAPEGAGYTNGLADATYTVFNNCVINGTLGLDYSCEFNNCEFNISGDYYNVWTWGAGTVSFNKCTFNCDGKALLVYANVLDNGTSHQTVNINGCTFNDNGDDTITGKAAIEITDTYPANNITYDVIINETTVNGFSVTTQNATTFGGTDLGTNVWGNKNLLTTDDLNVVIDGVDVH